MIDLAVSAPEWMDWEGVARDFHERTGTDQPPVDARVQAARLKLAIRYELGPSHLDLEAREIIVNPRQHPTWVQIDIAHEVGHCLMLMHRMANLEAGAKYLSGALLGPRRLIDLDPKLWSIPALQAQHRNMPALALALRITQVRDAVATIFHPSRRMEPWRRASPWITDAAITKKIPKLERDFAASAWKLGTPEVHGVEQYVGLHATLVLDEYEDGPRVIVVRDLSQLNLRFIDG